MISYSHAIELLTQVASEFKQDYESLEIENAIGRVLAENVFSPERSPPFDNSAMDGFAVNSEHINLKFSEGINQIKVSRMIAAGDDLNPSFNLQDSVEQAVEIMTGAPMPNNKFDTVARIEDVEVNRDQDGRAHVITLKSKVKPGDNVRKAGEDIQVKDLILPIGTILHENHLLAFATLGITKVKVTGSIKCAIASTGKEIVSYKSTHLTRGKIRNSTGVYLQSYLKKPGVEVLNLGILEDSPDTYLKALYNALDSGVEVFVSTGAVSMGQFDFVNETLSKIDAQIVFHKCAIRPGKPILFAKLFYKGKNRYIFGVPGNPVSTAVGLRFFIMPFLEKLQGKERYKPYKAILSSDIKKPEGFRCFFKASSYLEETQQMVTSLKGQASFMVKPMLIANSWVVLPEEHSLIQKGTIVEVYSL